MLPAPAQSASFVRVRRIETPAQETCGHDLRLVEPHPSRIRLRLCKNLFPDASWFLDAEPSKLELARRKALVQT